MSKIFFDHYGKKLNQLKPISDAKKILSEIAKQHTLVIISSTIEPLIERFLKKYALNKYFASILGKNFNRSKIIKIKFALKKYNFKPTQSLFITDTVGDMLEAKKCGVGSIAVSWGFHSISLLKKYNPLAIVKIPVELVKLISSELNISNSHFNL